MRGEKPKMTCWLCITNEENWNVVKEKNIWGVADRHLNTIARVKKGDTVLMYLKWEKIGDKIKESRIAGVFEVDSDVFVDSARTFKVPKGIGDEIFPFRIKLMPVDVFKEPIEFKSLTPQLKFITNKKKWGGHLMGKAMRPIPKEDFETIINSK